MSGASRFRLLIVAVAVLQSCVYSEEELGSSNAEIRYNNNAEYVLVWSQNIGMMGMPKDACSGDTCDWMPGDQVRDNHNWRNIIECAYDKECNGFRDEEKKSATVIPDIFLLQECSQNMADAFVEHLRMRDPNESWVAESDDRYLPESRYWLSNCIIYREARFYKEGELDIPVFRGNGKQPCGDGTKREVTVPNLRLVDMLRMHLGTEASRISLVTKHDDHFTGIDPDQNSICDETIFDEVTGESEQSDDRFCTWKNNKMIHAQMLRAELGIVSGDWNYQARKCEGQKKKFRYAYARTTKSILSDDISLGWRDPVYERRPHYYKDGWVDINYIHTRWSDGNHKLMPKKTRNSVAGRIGKCFYCPHKDGKKPISAYVRKKNIPDKATFRTAVMSDHDGLFMKLYYDEDPSADLSPHANIWDDDTGDDSWDAEADEEGDEGDYDQDVGDYGDGGK